MTSTLPTHQHTIIVAPRMHIVSKIGVHAQWILGPVIIDNEYWCFYKFMKSKPLVFQGTQSYDASKFLINYRECLHKMGIIENYGVDFVFF